MAILVLLWTVQFSNCTDRVEWSAWYHLKNVFIGPPSPLPPRAIKISNEKWILLCQISLLHFSFHSLFVSRSPFCYSCDFIIGQFSTLTSPTKTALIQLTVFFFSACFRSLNFDFKFCLVPSTVGWKKEEGTRKKKSLDIIL